MSDFNDILKCIQATGKPPQDNNLNKSNSQSVLSTKTANESLQKTSADFAIEFMAVKKED